MTTRSMTWRLHPPRSDMNQTDLPLLHKKLLLVEDELQISDLYQHILSQAGLKIIAAFDGEEGLKLAQTRPDLILLDIMLPKKNGMTVLHELKSNEQTKDIPVILLTNLGQADIIKTA